MPIATLQFTNLGPFDGVEFEFDPQVNVFVGPNNCGKSTTLFALANISVYSFDLPRKLIRRKSSVFHAQFVDPLREVRDFNGTFPISPNNEDWDKRKLVFARLVQRILGYTTFVPALRWSTDFRSEGPMPQDKRESISATKAYFSHDRETRRLLALFDDRNNPSLVRDSEVVQQMVELDYRSYRQKKPAMRRIIDKIASIASEITEGFPIAFAGIAEDKGGLYPQFDTPDGKVPLDVLSQGTQSLIQWLARLLIGYAQHYDFPGGYKDKAGVLIIDEIDAHLHPSWQRRIIPAITREFPSLQIFCSTHSPLMLAGLKAGQIHLLTRGQKGEVTASRNETDIVGWSTDEIVTTFLGVESATDLETAQKLERLQELRGKKRLVAKEREELERLRKTMNQRLLSGPAVDEVEELAQRLKVSRSKVLQTHTKPPARRKKSTTSVPRKGKK